MPRHEDPPAKPFRIQRRRLGVIKYMRPEGDFGFIEAEDFREDVFFHKSAWQAVGEGPLSEPRTGLYVEFELDDDYRAQENKLRASVVRRTNRPMGRRLSMRETPHLANSHHPKARRKRPTWRQGPDSPPPAES